MGLRGVWVRVAAETILDLDEPEGSLVIYRPRETMFAGRVSGHLTRAMAQRWMDVITPYFKGDAAFDVFLDWEHMTGYDSEARRDLTAWVIANKKHVKSARIFVTSRLVRMGVAAANLATTLVGLTMATDASRAEFEHAIAECLSAR